MSKLVTFRAPFSPQLAHCIPYVACYRVSTLQQGKRGLGLAAQQQMVRRFVKEDTVLGALPWHLLL